MIERTASFKTTDGTMFASLELAKCHELELLFVDLGLPVSTTAADIVVKNSERIIDILTTKPSSLVRARKANGGTKKRTAKNPQTVLPGPMSAAAGQGSAKPGFVV